MNRRGFLGFLGGAAAAGPSAAKAAANMSVADLSIGETYWASATKSGSAIVGTIEDNKGWAQTELMRLLGKTAEQIAREQRSFYVSSLDPDTAALRSMTLASKIRMQKRVSWERSEREHTERCRGILAGWLD